MENKSKIIYIASPYSSTDEKKRIENYEKVSKFTAHLISNGAVAISPIAYGHPLLGFVDMPGDWEFWKNFCITFLEKCDEMIVLQLEGWDKSRGVLEEIEYCKNKNIPVWYMTQQDL